MITSFFAATALLAPGTTELTVYIQGLGFVKEVRNVQLKKGQQTLAIEDVTQLIDASSVAIKCLNNPGSLTVLEQNYQYDLISPMAILNKSVGKRVRFTRAMGNTKESIEGILISSPTSVTNSGNGSSYSYNGLVIKATDGRIILSPQGEIDVLEPPEGLISKPTLLWQVESEQEQDAKLELSYLTNGFNWNANYVFTVDDKGKGDLQGWVSLTNNSGLSFKDAKLKLLAGDVNVVREKSKLSAFDMATLGGRPVTPKMTEESLFEYHLYTLGRPATVKDKETKQLSLLEGFSVPYQKQIVVDSTNYGWSDTSEVATLSPTVRIKFANTEKANLGKPMPAGKIRLYSRDSAGSVQFLGEDTIEHTPSGETITLAVGKSFDIVANRRITSLKKISKSTLRRTIQIEVRNRKKVSETVLVYERLHGAFTVVDKSDPFVKQDAGTIVFSINLKPNEVRKITYSFDAKVGNSAFFGG